MPYFHFENLREYTKLPTDYYCFTIINYTFVHISVSSCIMKKRIPFLILFGFMCLIGPSLHSQQQSCNDPLINQQVDSLKSLYLQDGFTLLREASISMESEFEMPVIMPLTEGTWYQFVFIGEYSSRLYEVRMFDANEKQVIFQQKKWGDVDGNIISFSYIPRFSEFHMMRPVQVNKKKKKNLCGYVMMFKKNVPPAGS